MQGKWNYCDLRKACISDLSVAIYLFKWVCDTKCAKCVNHQITEWGGPNLESSTETLELLFAFDFEPDRDICDLGSSRVHPARVPKLFMLTIVLNKLAKGNSTAAPRLTL